MFVSLYLTKVTKLTKSGPGKEKDKTVILHNSHITNDLCCWPHKKSLLSVSSVLLRRFREFDMTKLTEWIVFAGLAFSIWITLLMDILPLKVSYKAKEMIWPVRSEDVLQKLYIIKEIFCNHSSAEWNNLSLSDL